MKKLPESPFKETQKLTEKLLLDIADKTDKALIDSLNDLIKAGILEVKYLVPHSEFNENYLTVKSGVQVVPKFDEYTKKLEEQVLIWKSAHQKEVVYHLDTKDLCKKLESENSELKKKLSIIDFDYSSKLEKEIQTLKGKMVRIGQKNQDLRKQLHQTLEDLSDEIFKHQGLQFRHECLQEKYSKFTYDLTAAQEAMDFLRKFLNLGKE